MKTVHIKAGYGDRGMGPGTNWQELTACGLLLEDVSRRCEILERHGLARHAGRSVCTSCADALRPSPNRSKEP